MNKPISERSWDDAQLTIGPVCLSFNIDKRILTVHMLYVKFISQIKTISHNIINNTAYYGS